MNINYIICNTFYCLGQKSTSNNTKFDIFEDEYLSQGLTSILHNTDRLQMSKMGERGGMGVTPPPQTAGGVTWSQPHSIHRNVETILAVETMLD